MEEEFLNKLTFPFRVRTGKIIELKQEKNEFKTIDNQLSIFIIIIMLISSVIIMFKWDIYIGYYSNIINSIDKFRFSFPSLGQFYKIILWTFILSCIIPRNNNIYLQMY